MDLEIKIRRRTEAEMLERIEQVRARACWFCQSKVVPAPFAPGEECAGEQATWFGVKICGYCLGGTFTYFGRHFFEESDKTKPINRRKRYDFMQKEQNVCALLHKLNLTLQREIKLAQIREKW